MTEIDSHNMDTGRVDDAEVLIAWRSVPTVADRMTDLNPQTQFEERNVLEEILGPFLINNQLEVYWAGE